MLGIVSLILWALMAMVSLKYVTFVLRADNEGEGGILALLSLVAAGRVANGARLPVLVLLGVIGAVAAVWRRRHHAGDFGAVGDGRAEAGRAQLRAFHRAGHDRDPDRPVRDPALRHRADRQIVRPGHGGLVRRALRSSALVNILKAPAILQAVNPLAGRALPCWPIRKISFVVIGAVFLALTGGEALYADMGHVGATAIRRAWFGLVLPALMLNYFGQGALILDRSRRRRQSVLPAGARPGR